MSLSGTPTIAVVLGAGGVVGHAFHVGVLSALVDEFGWDCRDAGIVVGTSAGSVVGASLRAGIGPLDMRRRLVGEPLSAPAADLVRRAEVAVAALDRTRTESSGGGDADRAEQTAVATISRRLRIASPDRLRRALREPWKVRPGSLVSAVLPVGRRSTAHLRAPYDAMLGRSWPDSRLWIVAVDLDTGTRVVFGRPGTAAVSVGQAVEASCAIPGYFAPVTIDGARYVDGAVHSTTNADLASAAEPRPDLAIVSAPMAAVGGAMPRTQALSMRQLARRQVALEVGTLRSRGIRTVTFQPTTADLDVMVGGSMEEGKAAAVCAQVVQSTRRHLRDSDVAERLAPLRR